MADENAAGSRTEAPTGRRLSEARAQGDTPKSADLTAFATLFGASLFLLTAGGLAIQQTALRLLPFIQNPDAMAGSGGGLQWVSGAAAAAAAPMMWVLAATAAAAVAGNLLQQGFIWAPSRLAPDLSRLSPARGLQRLFGIDGLIQFARSLLKIIAVGATVYVLLRPKAVLLASLAALDVAAILPFAAEILKALMIAALIVFGVIGGLDFIVQRYRFNERLKMTREEVKEDTKNAEGDPHIRARLRQLRMRRARARMIQSVPKATVVVMNPTHYAVALRYVQGETPAPVCVAKGVDALALRIRDVAREHEVAVVEDPPLARALYAAMDVDEAIPREHYEAVAKVIGFVLGQAQRRSTPRGGRL
jgi:flagellar biosynthetic protein FlhB